MKEIKLTRSFFGGLVCHFLDLITPKERNKLLSEHPGIEYVEAAWNFALNKARKIGGKAYHNAEYGGGIIFSGYSEKELQTEIQKLLSK